MKPYKERRRRYRGQTLVEFALVVPIMLLVLFAIIEIARLLFAWVSIENGARFGVRYAVTGEYDDANCSIFPGSICDTQSERDSARIPSIHSAAQSGAAAIWHDPSAVDGQRGFLKVTVCSNKSGVVYHPPISSAGISADCTPGEDSGNPGQRVSVTLDFDHPIIAPIISSWLPQIRLTARREGIIEQFRVARVVGLPPTSIQPTWTATITPTATETPTETTTPIPTATITQTPTPCKVPPIVEIHRPSEGDFISGPGSKLYSYATAYDPDNVDPITCMGVGPDGLGILQVEFQFYWWDGTGWAWRYTSVDFTQSYCGFGGNAPCNGHPVNTGNWPNGAGMEAGLHKMTARALDDEGVWSNVEQVTFTLNVPDTPTPTPTNTPSCSGVSFGMFRFFSEARIARWINNTSYPGLEVTGVTVDWDPLEAASNLYGWNEYMDWMRWNGTTIHTGNPKSSTTSANKSLPQPVNMGVNANYVYMDFNGGFNGYLSSAPLNFTPSHFGFTVHFSDPACNLTSAAIAYVPPPPTPTPTPTGSPTITPTPPATSTSTTVPTATITPSPTYTPVPTNTPVPNCNLLQMIGTQLKNNHFDIRIINSNVQTAYLVSTTLEWNTDYAPPMYFDVFKFKGTSYGSSSFNSPVNAAAPNIGITQGQDRWWEAHFDLGGQPFHGFYRGTLTFDFPGWGTCDVVGSYWAPPPPTPTSTGPPTTPTRTATPTSPPNTFTPTTTLTPTVTPTERSFD
jgi:hypothetical protein